MNVTMLVLLIVLGSESARCGCKQKPMMAASVETLARLQMEAAPKQPNFRESGGHRNES